MKPGTNTPDAEFTKKAQQYALQHGLILLTCGMYYNVMRFLFPLTIEDAVFRSPGHHGSRAAPRRRLILPPEGHPLVGRLPVITGKPDMLNLKDPELLRQQCYIDGAWVDADNGATLDVTNPATGELVARVPKMGAAETRRAIEAAERAWPAWKRKTAKERSAIPAPLV